jgi:hypothetical protein
MGWSVDKIEVTNARSSTWEVFDGRKNNEFFGSRPVARRRTASRSSISGASIMVLLLSLQEGSVRKRVTCGVDVQYYGVSCVIA